jgi:hypothetical protein
MSSRWQIERQRYCHAVNANADELTAAAAISVASFARELVRKSGVPDLRGRRATHRIRKIGAVSRISL